MTESNFRILYGILVVLVAVGPAYLFHRFMAPVVSTISYKSGRIAAKFGGPAALYIVIIWFLFNLLPPQPPCYQAWKVTGSVKLEDEEELLERNDITLLPSRTDVNGGYFIIDVIAKPNAVGKPELPKLQVSHQRYKSVTIPLEAGKQSTCTGYTEVQVDTQNKSIEIGQFVLSKR
jgi:hypothetical protein